MKREANVIEALNDLLAQEHACAIRYATHAAVVTGPYSEAVSARLEEIAGDELLHAAKLRERILALGGEPTMAVSSDDLRAATTLDQILAVNIEEERQAVKQYTDVLEAVPEANVILHQSLQEIIRDEQEHLEELEGLQNPKG